MKTKMWSFVVVVVLVATGIGRAQLLYLNHFDNTTGSTAADRLGADYGLGGTAVTGLTSQDGARPDLVTNQKMFGDAAVQMAWNTGQTEQLLYNAQGNVNPQHGSFECWLYDTSYQNRHFSMFQVSDAQNSILVVNDGDSATRGKFEYRVRTAGGVETAYLSNNVMPRYSWAHLAIDWKLDSDIDSENFVRAWMNGTKQIDVVGFSKSTMNLTDTSKMALFSRTGTPGVDLAWLGNGDEVRITDTLISDLYALDGSGGFAVSTAAFVPEPASLVLLGLGSIALLRRKR